MPRMCWPKPCRALWPGTQVTIGPVIENGFYYDFFRNQPFTPEDLAGDREEDARDHRARQTLHQGGMVAREDQAGVPRQGRDVQGRTGRRHSRQRADQDLQAGRLVRPLPRPAHDLDRQGRQRLQADEGRGRLLARRFQQPDADPHLRHRLRQAGRTRRLSEADGGSREARPPQARPRDGPLPFPGGRPRHRVLARRRAGPSSRRSSPICAAACTATTRR